MYSNPCMNDNLPALPALAPGRYRHYKGGVFQAEAENCQSLVPAGRRDSMPTARGSEQRMKHQAVGKRSALCPAPHRRRHRLMPPSVWAYSSGRKTHEVRHEHDAPTRERDRLMQAVNDRF